MNARTPRGMPVGGLPRVNLLPPTELTRRSNAALGRRWARIVLGAVAVVAALVIGLHALNLIAVTRLAAEQLRTQTLMTELAELAPVSQAMSARIGLQTQREQAMAGDLAWQPVLATLASGVPGGAQITGYDLTAGPAPAGDDPTTQIGLTGTVTLSSAAPIEFTAATARLRTLEPVSSVDVQNLSNEEGVYQYAVTVVLDQTIYSGDFAPAAEKQKAN
ncbi:hypothetical protein V2S04_03610 [Microbacterium sp. OR21]|uniref:hypothetical protein n=1 Tax=Microbacterium sp. OR21 TaxID=3095346 RepID=UPI0039B58C9E